MNCVICGKECLPYRMTDSPDCHEKFVEFLEEKFGKYKKMTRMATGQAFKVPLRDIIEKGLRDQDLDKYPIWED